MKKALLLSTSLLALQPFAAFAGNYQALCGGTACTVSISPEQITSPSGTIPVSRVTSWNGGGSSQTDVTTGVVTTFIFGLPGLLGFNAKKHDYNFTVAGFDTEGRKTAIQFQFINDAPAKQVMAELPVVTGLGMNQQRTEDEIAAIERGERSLVASSTSLGQSKTSSLGRLGETKQVATKPCWDEYLKTNTALGTWAKANPGLAEAQRVRGGFDICKPAA